MSPIYGTMLSQYRRDAAIAFATAKGLAHRAAQGRLLLGWALAMQGDATAGMAHIHEGLEVVQRTGLKLYRPYFLALLAEASGQAGQPEAGLTVLAEARTLVAATEERWWEAELYRLQGELLLQRPLLDVGQAEGCFLQALDVARRQQAKALELRAALSLARLWQRQGQCAAARQLLAEIYGWFTEGFDTSGLRDAKALLEELKASHGRHLSFPHIHRTDRRSGDTAPAAVGSERTRAGYADHSTIPVHSKAGRPHTPDCKQEAHLSALIGSLSKPSLVFQS
jgi:predicted ATPase